MFTTPCFIKKNTPELHEKLEKLGYEICRCCYGWGCSGYLYTTGISVHSTNVDADLEDSIDCGENEGLFLALAALRDDSDFMQWFTDDLNNFVKCTCDDINSIEKEKIEWEYFCKGLKGKLRKATPEQLIKHFKKSRS